MTISRRYLAAAGVLLAVACGSGGSWSLASTFLKTDIPNLTRMSDAVIQARVVDLRSAWNAEGTMIFTHVTLNVVRTLHGRSDDRIVVRVPGGTVEGFTVEMPGAPVFQRHDHVVAFIARWDDGAPRVAGYYQGLSRLVPDRLGNLILRGGVADGLPLSDLVRQLGRAGR